MLAKTLRIGVFLMLLMAFTIPAYAQAAFEEEGTVGAVGATTFELDVTGVVYTVTPPVGFELTLLETGDTVKVVGTLEDTTQNVTATSVALQGTWSGAVASIGAATFDLEVAPGEVYTVTPPAGYDLTLLHAGDLVEVTGWLEGVAITADSIEVLAVAIDVIGTVVTVDVAAFTIDAEGTLYTVTPPAGFDLTKIQAGDTVRVVGTLVEQTITASQVLVAVEYVGTVVTAGSPFEFLADDGQTYLVTPTADYVPMAGDVLIVAGWLDGDAILAESITVLFKGDGSDLVKNGFYCQDLAEHHPVAERLAEEYGVYYEQVMSWFCVGNFGFGEIKNALKAEELLMGDHTINEILAMKEELGGWGKVKQELGLIGKDKEADDEGLDPASEKNENHGKPETTGNPHEEQVGPPDHANNDKDKDKNKNK